MGNIAVRGTESYIQFFFFQIPHSRYIRKSVTVRYQIRLLFRSNDHGISRRDISTFKSLLVRLFYIYSRYVHFYIRVYMTIYFSTFCSSGPITRLLSRRFHFIPSRHSFNAILDVLGWYTSRRNTLDLTWISIGDQKFTQYSLALYNNREWR